MPKNENSAFENLYNKVILEQDDLPTAAPGDAPLGPTPPPPPPPSQQPSTTDTLGAPTDEDDKDKNIKANEEADKNDPNKDTQNDEEKQEDIDKKKKTIEDAREQESEKRDELVDTFNEENKDSTIVELIPYEKTPDYSKAFKVTLNISPEDIYLDRSKYAKGKTEIEITDIFYNDVAKIASGLGIKRVEWRNNEDGKFGVIVLDPLIAKEE